MTAVKFVEQVKFRINFTSPAIYPLSFWDWRWYLLNKVITRFNHKYWYKKFGKLRFNGKNLVSISLGGKAVKSLYFFFCLINLFNKRVFTYTELLETFSLYILNCYIFACFIMVIPSMVVIRAVSYWIFIRWENRRVSPIVNEIKLKGSCGQLLFIPLSFLLWPFRLNPKGMLAHYQNVSLSVFIKYTSWWIVQYVFS